MRRGQSGSVRTTIVVFLAMVSTARGERPPNILMLMPDQERWDWGGFDGDWLKRPNLAALAAKGTRFLRAYTPSPLCESARGSIASGMEYDANPQKNRLHNYPCPDSDFTTFYKLLQDHGYHTMMVGKDHLTGSTGVGLNGSTNSECLGWSDQIRTNDKFQNTRYEEPRDPYAEFLSKHWVPGKDGGPNVNAFDAQKACYGYFGAGNCTERIHMKSFPWIPLDELEADPGVFAPHTDIGQAFYPDDWVRNQSEEIFLRRPKNKPWFMQVGFPGPHPPFVITDEMNASVSGRTFPPPVQGTEIEQDIQQFMRRSYAAEIENIDRLVGEILGYLQAAGELEHTLVVYTSDHGEELGDYNLLGKMNPWEASIRVPLIIAGPGLKRGHVVADPVTTLDVVGTFLEAASAMPYASMSTQSLLPLLREGSASVSPTRTHITSGLTYTKANRHWRLVVRRINETTTLKFVCCRFARCPDSPFFMLDRLPPGEVQLLEVGDSPERRNLLPSGLPEALQLAQLLPGGFREPCERLLREGHFHPGPPRSSLSAPPKLDEYVAWTSAAGGEDKLGSRLGGGVTYV